MNKINVGIIYGGKSAEHEVSIESARNIVKAIDPDRYNVTLIGIDDTGRWYLGNSTKLLTAEGPKKLSKFEDGSLPVTLIPQSNSLQFVGNTGDLQRSASLGALDVVFPVLHGPYGEDGSIQGLFKLANIPYVGSDVLGSAVAMDKDVTKRLLRERDIPTPRFLSYQSYCKSEINFQYVAEQLGLPVFIKPANLGSSVGVTKARDEEEFRRGLSLAFNYDNKIMIEENIPGREIECAVLGGAPPMASVPGEIIVNSDFYSYEAKYIDEESAVMNIPADVPADTAREIQKLACDVFQATCCHGMARVDFLLRNDGKLFVNEINSIPGFTNISMFPKLWEASGLSYSELIDRLIQLAIERFDSEQKLKTRVEL